MERNRLKAVAKELAKDLKTEQDLNTLMADLLKLSVETALSAELTEHLGYDKHEKVGYNTGNSRNGTFKKTIFTENVGEVNLDIPRDRNGEFKPLIIPKGESVSSKIEDAILGMYSRGMTTSDITNQVSEIYGLDVSETTISNRPLT